MMCVLAIDLATRRYTDIGVALLRQTKQTIQVDFVRLEKPDWVGEPDVTRLVAWVDDLAHREGVTVLAIDGPQAWKAPDSGLVHARIGEHLLHTQTKTGLPGRAKPGTALRFVDFSLQCFDQLAERGWPRLSTPNDPAPGSKVAVEVYPTAVWRALGLKPLPAKAKCAPPAVAQWLGQLQAIRALELTQIPAHDELQALVVGLVGLAVATGRAEDYQCYGEAPFLLAGAWREGYLVNLKMNPSRARRRGSSRRVPL